MTKLSKNWPIVLIALITWLNFNWLKSPVLGIIFGLIYLIIFGYALGQLIFPKEKYSQFDNSRQFLVGIFSLISLYSLIGAIVYFFFQLNLSAVNLIYIIISGLIIILGAKKFNWPKFKINLDECKNANYLFIITYLILFALSLFFLFRGQTVNAINSPWQVLPSYFLFIYFLATINLIYLIFKNKNGLSLILTLLHFFLTTSIALIVYKLGYGYDSFIHQATEKAIFENGVILPKNFYYLGQYSIVVIFSRLFQVSVELIDKLLLPILVSVFLPYFIYQSLKNGLRWTKENSLLSALIFLILPFTLLIFTNPQAIALIFSLIILFLSFLNYQEIILPFRYLFFLSITAIIIHPLAGLPIMIYVLIQWLWEKKGLYKKIILPLLMVFSAFILPLALFVNSIFSLNKVTINRNPIAWLNTFKIFSLKYIYYLDLIYLLKGFIFILMIIAVIYVLIKLLKQKNATVFIAAFLTAGILIINAFLLNFINISTIINYEQGDFSNRIFTLVFYFLLPFFIYAVYILFERIKNRERLYFAFLIISLGIFLTANLYLSYPHYDNFEKNKFVNLTQADLNIVNLIEKNKTGNYIVLANQMTSAAAIKTFGFNPEYNGQYFYPIPTGAPLYSYFLDMIYKDQPRSTMIAAMNLMGVNEAYFLIPKYWNNYDKIVAKVKKEANQGYEINGQIYVFKFIR